ncbi:beta-lactamase family protein [Glycomyces sp. TRM65418]|uniref:serine hydrolase domain-containing protein n=1 Tax=Glycomyces sp. TRM65418 TaxID=2867006 RepID=UPI001CE67601|nr:serine hydrolase domain-containing protein [Glycomyces sp. TRM65418]MCC3765597.1 beta-lactamase family protein [Glycomyces sp. TRM65418]QZD55198.1 beta-lactamase family protein [Glycomyces sp. TRM65418]
MLDTETTPRRGRIAARTSAALAVAALLAATAACGSEPVLPEQRADEPTAPQPLTSENVDAWLDDVLVPELEEDGIVGATVAVVGGGEVLTTRGFGYADIERQLPVDPEQTLFRIGSVSKVLTANAVMQLVEQGRIDLDTDVSAYLDFEFEREFDDDVTMRHLLSHTAGFEERLRGLMGSGDVSADLREALVNDPPEQVYRPGTTPSYSNYGNALAGYIVERVSGESFEDYIDHHLFEPLGLSASTFRQPLPDGLRDQMSNGYTADSGPAEPFEVVSMPPAGSASMSTADMARFMIEQLGALPDEQSLLSDETREQMFAPALTEEALGGFAEAPRMALGYFQTDRNGHRIVSHGGDTELFHTEMQLYPDDGAGIYISVNSNGNENADLQALRTDLVHAFADRYFPAESTDRAAAVDAETMRENAEAAAGTYVASRGFHSTFLSVLDAIQTFEFSVLDDGRLYLEAHPFTGEPTVYEQLGDHLWQDVASQGQIAVRVEDGDVTGIVHDNAFTMLPLSADRAMATPVLLASAAVLLIGLIAWPAAAIYRKVRGRPAPERGGRPYRTLIRIAAACSLLALAGWAAIVLTLMQLQEVPDLAIRGTQALQLIGLLGMIPAAVKVVRDLRRKAGWRPVAWAVLMLLALSGIANFAIEYQMLAPDLSY